MPFAESWSSLVDELAAFALSGCCAGCDLLGTLLCDECGQALIAAPMRQKTPGGLPVTAALVYRAVTARCIRRLKEEGETLLSRPLGTALGTALEAAIADGAYGAERPLLVPVPTSTAAFRRRGYRVPELLIRRAGFASSRLLASVRSTADQRGLGALERGRNVSGSMRARHARDAREVLVIDDVVTTGATLDEAARALTTAGFRVRGAVALAATPRHSGFQANAS
ncbi:ComF family protein [Microbacterium profundi]|uniref:ComF family protein n=1 Tax=Microbacterium profundi TaxID=450380 RepID=UPI001F1732B0|nr:phosphoribosyltransferase family protein [Microbacterium profundi]MCE7480363.1 ComF family protein [Microbacterium profundi]